MSYSRFAIYYLPPDGPLADFGAQWLGWDINRGQQARQLEVPGLAKLTKKPRKYGFHGTLKAPFRLNPDASASALDGAMRDLAAAQPRARADGLAPTTMGGFLALTPRGNTDGLRNLAEACVRGLDDFRAPPSDAELERRRRANLTMRQDALLEQWGYPYVMDEFRFHLTLSGRVPRAEDGEWSQTLHAHLPAVPEPFVIEDICLCGEREDQRFELIKRYALTG